MTLEDFISAFHRPIVVSTIKDEPFPHAKQAAAVLICIYHTQNIPHILFTERAQHLKHHAGQISFPGGKHENTDRDLIETAYRETEEEVGLNKNNLKLIGQLPAYRTVSGFAVSPIISYYTTELCIDRDLQIDPNEVASVFGVPLSFAMNKKHYHEHMIMRDKGHFPVYFLPYKERMIWGATAGMLALLQKHVNA